MQQSTRSIIWMIGIALAGVATLLRLRPALLRNIEIVRQEPAANGNYTLVHLAWSYRLGARPTSLIIDLSDSQGQRGSLTSDGESTGGSIPLAMPPMPPCTLHVSSVHRLAGFPRETPQTFDV